MATSIPTMKTNIYLGFTFISGFTALAFGAGFIAVFAVVTTIGFLGLACYDYAPSRPIGFGPTA